MESLIFIDSNIWCYYFDRSAIEHDIVSERLEWALHEGVAIDTVAEIEVAHYLIKNMGSQGKKKMEVFLSFPIRIISFDQCLAKRSIDLLAEYSQTGIGG